MEQPRMTVSERRATYPLQRRLKIYSPDTMARHLNQEKTTNKLVVNGVNILNKSCLEKEIIMDRIQQRRETHNRVERRRRVMLNGLINELAEAIPTTVSSDAEKCHRAQILRHAIDYIHSIQRENEIMKAQLGQRATVSDVNDHCIAEDGSSGPLEAAYDSSSCLPIPNSSSSGSSDSSSTSSSPAKLIGSPPYI